MKRKIIRWQIASFVFTILSGMLLHMLYVWTGQSLIVALFCAVNESIWEHMKLLFFPAFLFAFIEYRALIKLSRHSYPGKPASLHRYWGIKLAGITLGTALIPIMFYTFQGIAGDSPEWFNIIIYLVSIGATFLLETKLLLQEDSNSRSHSRTVSLSWLGILLLCLIAITFFIFTFMPPHIPLFQDAATGQYGVGSR